MNANPLAEAFRRWGYLEADLDPLGRVAAFRHPDLAAAMAEAGATGEAARWRAWYCGPIGIEFMHLPYPDRLRFICERMEADGGSRETALELDPRRSRETAAELDPRRILVRLAEAELLERFLHQRFVGTKRYSLEGAAALIPLLDAILEGAAARGAGKILIGMPHRGRLNVMAHVVGVPLARLFAGFEDIDPRSVLGGGDLKYHQGATGTWRSPDGRALDVHLVSNPSHLEAVDPVVMGRARACRDRAGEDGRDRVLALTLHGDAAFAGQGIAAETLNLSGLPGYTVGGTLHVVINNLIGFTTGPGSLHTTRFASDVAKRLDVPIVHVNGQDPEAVVRAGRLALEYRDTFHTDVVVDLVCYRRYGHSEVDDPTTTQPLLYAKIAALPMLWEAYAERTGVAQPETRRLREQIEGRLLAGLDESRAMTERPSLSTTPSYWDPYTGGRYDPHGEIDTAVAPDQLLRIARRIAAAPAGFHTHPKVEKGLAQRLEMANGPRPVDWGMAEALALGSLLWDGVPVRLTGQDTRRGTFNQRHAVLFDTEDGREHAPLAHLTQGQGRFEIHDTPLSEAAPLGFEYGYSRDSPETLVCWEAQFGDFANGGQVIIDQFLVAGEGKWGLLSGLVLLLPHGYEGQGPEHSSARVERFLDLAGDDNIQVCQPSTSAQYFHLLRRQALRRWRKPLIVLTPKGLLRAPPACSSIGDLAAGRFRAVLPDAGGADSSAQRILVCSGKIAHELEAERDRRGERLTAIVRLEQFYPFPGEELEAALRIHPRAQEIVWVQEEPGNMGALDFVRPRLQSLAGDRHVLTVKRSDSASPATGSPGAHAREQEAILALAFASRR